jgi:REP element-mobilizing transposase RayT
MPRMPRKYIRTPFYHVMCQGIKKEAIFDTDERKRKYLNTIKLIKREFLINIITYCIMSNHVHLLIYAENIEELSRFMHKLNGIYGQYYNKREGRVGFVFRNRFRMEGVDSDKYIFDCIQYIHNNPVKAGICKTPSEYMYSGYNEFNGKTQIIDSVTIQKILGDETYQEKEQKTKKEKINFIDSYVDNDDVCQEMIKCFLEYNKITIKDVLDNEEMLIKLLIDLRVNNNLSYSCIEKNLLINRKRLSSLCPKKGQA